MQPSVIVGGGKVNPKHCFSARGIIWLQTDGFGDGCLQTNPWRNNMKEICDEQRAYVCLEIQDARGRSLIKNPISWYLINQLQKVCCTKWWDLLTSRLRSLRSCHASIIKGCCLCFSSFHHCSYIKLCGQSLLQHLRDRQWPSITTGTCPCQQFYAGFCWGCHTNGSCKFVCAASIMRAQKMTEERVERQVSSFLPSESIPVYLASMGKHWRPLQCVRICVSKCGAKDGGVGGGLSQGWAWCLYSVISLVGKKAGAYTAQYFAMTELGGSIQC